MERKPSLVFAATNNQIAANPTFPKISWLDQPSNNFTHYKERKTKSVQHIIYQIRQYKSMEILLVNFAKNLIFSHNYIRVFKPLKKRHNNWLFFPLPAALPINFGYHHLEMHFRHKNAHFPWLFCPYLCIPYPKFVSADSCNSPLSDSRRGEEEKVSFFFPSFFLSPPLQIKRTAMYYVGREHTALTHYALCTYCSSTTPLLGKSLTSQLS